MKSFFESKVCKRNIEYKKVLVSLGELYHRQIPSLTLVNSENNSKLILLQFVHKITIKIKT